MTADALPRLQVRTPRSTRTLRQTKHAGRTFTVNAGSALSWTVQRIPDCSVRVTVSMGRHTDDYESPDQETKTKTEGTSGVLAMPFLSVSSIKTRASSCH